MAGISRDLPGGKYDTLVVAAEDVEVDEAESEIFFDASDGTDDGNKVNAHLALYDVDDAVVDQSRAKVEMKGGSGVTVLNRIDGCGNVAVKQDGAEAYVKAGKDSKMTAVNYITDTQGVVQLDGSSRMVVDGRGSRSGVVAHTVVGGNANVKITSHGSISVISG